MNKFLLALAATVFTLAICCSSGCESENDKYKPDPDKLPPAPTESRSGGDFLPTEGGE